MAKTYIYIACMALTTYAIRVLPLTLIRTELKSPLLRSFLFYLPYVTLAVMTFPGILSATQTPWSALVALIVGIILAWRGKSLFAVSVCCCLSVFLSELVLI